MLKDMYDDAFAKILQGGTRKALRGEAPFKSLDKDDKLVQEFATSFREAAPIFGLDFDKTVEPIVLAEIEKI